MVRRFAVFARAACFDAERRRGMTGHSPSAAGRCLRNVLVTTAKLSNREAMWCFFVSLMSDQGQ